MKKYLPTFTAAMQNYVKSPNAASKVSLLFRDSFDFLRGRQTVSRNLMGNILI